MTFIWARLTWPVWARRHAGPWSRKMSATSSAGRDIGCPASAEPPRQALHRLERAHHIADRPGGDMGVARGGLQPGMAEQDLDDPDVVRRENDSLDRFLIRLTLFQQMGGEAVPQHVRRHPLGDPRDRPRRHAGPVELARADRVERVLAGEQPPLPSAASWR